MFAWIAGKLLATPVIGTILKSIFTFVLNYQKQKLDAQASHEVQVADVAKKLMDVEAREAEADKQLLISEQGNWLTRSVRPLMAFPVIFILWKLLIWDKALGEWTHGTTDRLDDHMWWVITTVIVAYMGGRTAEKVADKIAGIWK